MKKLSLLVIISIAVLLITSCDTTETTDPPAAKGNLFLTSNPAGAEIWLAGNNTSQTTPDTVKDLDAAVYTVTLKLTDYNDTTFSVTVESGQTVVLIRIYETIGTTASQPSGLDLSTGSPWGVSSDSSHLVDIYYSSNGFLVQSANLFTGLIRETDFNVGTSDDIYDGTDSPLNNTGTDK